MSALNPAGGQWPLMKKAFGLFRNASLAAVTAQCNDKHFLKCIHDDVAKPN